MKAFIEFNQGILAMPIHWQIWILALLVVNMLIPSVFFKRTEARVVIATFLGALSVMTILTAVAGFSRIVGLGHFLWFPMLYFIRNRLADYPARDFYATWMRSVLILNSLALAIDVTDVIRYIAGDR